MRWLLKRWWFWAGTAFMLVAAVAGYVLIPVEQPRITQENCDKIQLGWSENEVEGLLGKGDRGTWPFVNLIWINEDGDSIQVNFNRSGVIEKRFTPSNLSLWESMKRRIERRIRALWP
jgi:hypothetical protein